MKLKDLTDTITKLKSTRPEYDYLYFSIRVNGEDITLENVDIQQCAINFSTPTHTEEEKPEKPEQPEMDM